MFDYETDVNYQTKKRKALKRKKQQKKTVIPEQLYLMCVESVKNLKKDGNIGQRPNLDRKKCELVEKCL